MADLIDRGELRKRIYSRFGRCSTKVIATVEEGRVMSDWAFLEPFLNAAPAVNRWISCSERLPEFEREVLVYVKGNFDNSIPFITTAYINSDCDWQSDYDGEVIDSKITHWMPIPEIPEPPKNEENSDE